MHIQRWFAIESPKEMSEVFAEVSAIYYIAQTGAGPQQARGEIERRLERITDPSEWFAACMCLEDLSLDWSPEVRWAAGR